MRKCHPVPKSVSEAILVFNSNFIYRAFSSRPLPGASPGLWSPRPAITIENKSFYRYGLERTPMVGAQEEERQPPNRRRSSRLPEPCAWLGTAYESCIAWSVPRSEMLGTQCLRRARRRWGIALRGPFRGRKRLLVEFKNKKEHMLFVVYFFFLSLLLHN